VAVGLFLIAASFLTTALDIKQSRVAFVQGQTRVKMVIAENISMESSPFKYYILYAIPLTIPTPYQRIGTISLYLHPNQLVFEREFDFPNFGTGYGEFRIEVPSPGRYMAEVHVLDGTYWADSNNLDVEVVSLSRPFLIISPIILALGVGTLAGVLKMLRRHRITVYGLTLENF
jgi:hypothetical protein